MFIYPERARLDRVLPKNKLYANVQPSRALRQRFVDQIDQIVWRYKLAAETINLPAHDGIEEIQVFELLLKTDALKEDVLRTIDRAIPSQIFFELRFQDKVRFVAAYKRQSEADAGASVIEAYFETAWQPVTAPRLAFPVALNMASLYEQMLRQHMSASSLALTSWTGETIRETVERANLIRVKRRECEKLEAQMRKELQFNRKVLINGALRACRGELAVLEGL